MNFARESCKFCQNSPADQLQLPTIPANDETSRYGCGLSLRETCFTMTDHRKPFKRMFLPNSLRGLCKLPAKLKICHLGLRMILSSKLLDSCLSPQALLVGIYRETVNSSGVSG